MPLPEGTVSFLFADIEGSTRLLAKHPGEYATALLRLDALIRGVVARANGVVFETVGDAVYVAFERASDALASAVNAQRALQAEDWGTLGVLRMRMALHTGEVERRGDHYFGAPLYRCARLMAIGHGAQVLVSATTAALVTDRLPLDTELREMGPHRLKDFPEAEVVFQLVHPQLRSDFPPLRSLDVLPNNLPIQATPFVGRHEERIGVIAAIAEHRLVTLTGPGGTGKTRLALEIAGDVLADYPGGVWFIELGPLADPPLVPRALAAALHIREEPDRPLEQTLADALAERATLLVLDNCEHLIEPVARLVATLLRGTAGVRALATSREPLALSEERVMAIAPLRPSEAARLFVERARFVSAAFDGRTDEATISTICRRLDGIPLAIELAASRVRAFSLAEIERQLDDRFRFLAAGDRTALPRHRTLRALIEWSYDLLEPRERDLLAALSVFAGGFDLDAATAIWRDDDSDVVALVGRLVDKSLVEARVPRYRLLDTIRAFAEEKLGPSAAAVRNRHLAWFVQFAERAEVDLTGPRQAESLARLENEHDNMRTAMRWAINGHDTESGLRLAGALSSFWATRGYWSEGRSWLGRLLALAEASTPGRAIQAKARHGEGSLAYRQGDYDRASELCEAALHVQREIGDTLGITLSLLSLGLVAAERGEHEQAAALFEEALTTARETGDTRYIARAFTNLGLLAWQMGNYEKATGLHQEALALNREIGDPYALSITLNNLGTVAHSRRDYRTAASLYEESLAVRRELGDKRGIALVLRNLGEIAYAEGDHTLATNRLSESLTFLRDLGAKGSIASLLDVLAGAAAGAGRPRRATILFGAAAGLRASLGATRRHVDLPEYEESLAVARAGQDEASFSAAWAKGQVMSFNEVVAFALGTDDG